MATSRPSQSSVLIFFSLHVCALLSLWIFLLNDVPSSFYFLGARSTFVSVPADFGGLSVDSYISGIIAGILAGAGFPARVTAHSVALEEGESVPSTATVSPSTGSASLAAAVGASLPPRKEKTVFLVKFAQSVLTRDSQMN